MQTTCSACGKELPPDAPRGLCPVCLFQLDEPMVANLADSADQLDSQRPARPACAFGRFGDYELLQEIARGGMGVVYKARQISLGRIVAVKMLPFGALASQEIVQRFRIEATAAASLQHPHIVAIHEVGFHDGQHFFAMEYVAGRSLAAIVKDGPLPPKRAAGYLKTIAEAIHYAHERNILHRDLKPSNILIDQFDQPKVTDFGLAKRLETELELTLSGQLLGSPNYMSPEQAAAKRGTVGKPSDVYALGAILYHLLTGRPPFVAPTVAETLHEVLNTEPVSPRVLNPGVPRDLETICLKCLEKDSARRYDTAEALARDIERHLNNEPVAARPPSRLYRFQKLVRRNKAAFGAGAAVFLMLVAGLVVSNWFFLREKAARQRAVAAEREQSQLRQQAQASEKKALTINRFLTEDLLGQSTPEPNSRQKKFTMEEMLEKATRSLDQRAEIGQQPEVEATLRLAIGHTYSHLQMLDAAERNLRRAFDLRRSALGPENLETLTAEYRLADLLIVTQNEKLQEGIRLSREAWLGRQRLLGVDNGDTLRSQALYYEALLFGGQLEEAESVARQMLPIRERLWGPDNEGTIGHLQTLARVLALRGDCASAERYVREALTRYQRLGEADRQEAFICIQELAMVRLMQADPAEAERLLTEAVPRAARILGPGNLLTLLLQRGLARTMAEEGRFAEAEALAKKTLAVRRRQMGDPEGTGRTLLTYGRVLVEQGKLDEAEPLLQEALTLFREDSANGDPWFRSVKAKPELSALAANWLGVIQIRLEAYPEAEALMLPGSDRFSAVDAEMSPNERRLAIGHIVSLYQAWGKSDEAAAWQKKLDQLQK